MGIQALIIGALAGMVVVHGLIAGDALVDSWQSRTAANALEAEVQATRFLVDGAQALAYERGLTSSILKGLDVAPTELAERRDLTDSALRSAMAALTADDPSRPVVVAVLDRLGDLRRTTDAALAQSPVPDTGWREAASVLVRDIEQAVFAHDIASRAVNAEIAALWLLTERALRLRVAIGQDGAPLNVVAFGSLTLTAATATEHRRLMGRIQEINEELLQRASTYPILQPYLDRIDETYWQTFIPLRSQLIEDSLDNRPPRISGAAYVAAIIPSIDAVVDLIHALTDQVASEAQAHATTMRQDLLVQAAVTLGYLMLAGLVIAFVHFRIARPITRMITDLEAAPTSDRAAPTGARNEVAKLQQAVKGFLSGRADLTASEARFKLAVKAASDGIWDWDLTTSRIWFSPQWKAQLGYADDELESSLDTWSGLIFPEDRDAALAMVEDYTSGRISSFEAVQRFRHKDGRTVLIHSRAVHESDAEGRIVRLVGAHTDITERTRALEALQASEAKFRNLSSQIPGVIYQWIEDPATGRRGFTYVSPRAQEIFGLSAEALVADWTLFRLHPDDMAAFDETITQATATLTDWQFDGRLVGDDDTPHWWRAYSRPEQQADGAVLFTGVLVDISDQKTALLALADKESELSSILESVIDGIITIDIRGIIQSANRAAEAVFGFTAQEMIGQNVNMLMPPEIAAEHDGYLDAYWRTGERRIIGTGRNVTGQRKDGTQFPLELSVSEITIASGRFYTGVVRDITERVSYEQELEYNRATMEERAIELAGLAEELEAARHEAESANAAKSQFLAVMSHELRTPMTGVLGMADLLLASDLGPRQRHWAVVLKRSGETLLTLLNDLLDFSKVEAGQLTLERLDFDLRDVIRDVVQLLENRASEKGLTLEWTVDAPPPPAVVGDPMRLRQVLFNLVGNALKFTAAGRVAVRLAAVDQTGENAPYHLRFEVEDTGIGIDDSQTPRLFHPFSQADLSTTRRFGGTGLGLAICKRLIEAMGGDIGYRSTPGVGSTFWFTLTMDEGSPLRLVEPLDTAPGLVTTPTDMPLRILVAEDNDTNRMLLNEVLEQQGHEVTAVVNGAEALEAFGQYRFDIILMDMQMPVMDGVQAARAIRATEAVPGSQPIIALTADVLAEQTLDGDAAKISAFLTKPVDWRRLHATMRRLSGRHGVPETKGPTPAPPEAGRAEEDAVVSDAAVFSRAWLDGLPTLTDARLDAILTSLLNRIDRPMEDLDAALQATDLAAAQRALHGLKGLAGQFGLMRLAALARRLEDAPGGVQDIATARSALWREVQAAKQAVSAFQTGETSRS